ncbi:MAG: hypothetical protein QNJ77_09930 [Acidimicrobiia bacterium]|nr:hypothetical protein [Acidimicrobiia bacterium]
MKLRIAIAFGIGYLLGAKAGRDRYEQLRRAYRRATTNENVRKVIDQGREIVDTGTAPIRGVVADQLTSASDAIRERTDGSGPRH